MIKNLTDEIVHWLAIGERGTSSEAIVEFLTGVKCVRSPFPCGGHPLDPDDLRRCRLLLDSCPGLVSHFREKMGGCSAYWRELLEVWDDLCETMDKEVPMWRAGANGFAPETYNKMQAALKRAQRGDRT